MVEKIKDQFARPRCNTTSTIDTDCSQEAWLTVSGSFLVYYFSHGIINSFGFLQTYYQTEFLTSTRSSTISLIGTTQIALMGFLVTISGAICDAYGFRVSKLILG
jgi:MCP family monocarboxylic acid transporter-like MFS transporter 10